MWHAPLSPAFFQPFHEVGSKLFRNQGAAYSDRFFCGILLMESQVRFREVEWHQTIIAQKHNHVAPCQLNALIEGQRTATAFCAMETDMRPQQTFITELVKRGLMTGKV